MLASGTIHWSTHGGEWRENRAMGSVASAGRKNNGFVCQPSLPSTVMTAATSPDQRSTGWCTLNNRPCPVWPMVISAMAGHP
eukprot:12122166-Alexandrium_andersonii.AAC.1